MPTSKKRKHGKQNTKQAQGANSANQSQQQRQTYSPFGLTPEMGWVYETSPEPPTDEDVRLHIVRLAYEKVMLEIKRRMDSIRWMLTKKYTTGYPAVDMETMGLNFRKIAELVLFATLVGNEERYSSLYEGVDREWRIGQIIDRVKAINPHYYPRPIKENRERKIIDFEDLPEGTWLTEDELKDMYSQCSSLIHARNPYQPALNLDDFKPKFSVWYQKIRTLLNHHTTILPDAANMVVCVMNQTSYGGNPKATIFANITDSSPEYQSGR